MVDFVDQRPTRPTDTLREQITRLRTPASVPHGIKIARSTEYTLYYDGAGTARRWDGDTIATFNKDMENLRASLNELDEKLKNGGNQISDGGKIVGDVKAKLDELEKNLTYANINANQANRNALTATKTAEAAQTAATNPETLATTLNGTNLLRGTALASGTVGASQLNITPEVAASVVNAMDVNSKRLVVTDDAILQRATVIEGIVTSELTANKVFTEKIVSRHIDAEKIVTEDLVARRLKVSEIASQMITGGLLQTDAAENRGVKLTTDGILAWDDNGKQTVKIDADGVNNRFTGTLATSADSEPGVTIYTDVARGPAGSRASIIEMRPQEVSMKAPTGVIRMDPQGYFTFGMKRHDDPINVYRGLSVDYNGGVNITEALRIAGNARINGLWSKTGSQQFITSGPWRIAPHSAQVVEFNIIKSPQMPVCIPVVGGVSNRLPVLATIDSASETKVVARAHNINNQTVSDVYLDLFVLPMAR